MEMQTPKIPPLKDHHYTESIRFCLAIGDFSHAYNILSSMRTKGFQPTQSCMESFAVAYAKSAINSASTSTKQSTLAHANNTISQSRAESAYKIAMALLGPSTRALGTIAKACAINGQWQMARTVLRCIHKSINTGTSENTLENVKRTQSCLLQECARQGNLKAALFFTSDVQDFSKNYWKINEMSEEQAVPINEDDFFAKFREFSDPSSLPRMNVGMHPQDWISLIQAASKSGEWRVCFNSLQFLRPYVARTKSHDGKGEFIDDFDQRYEQLTPALTTVVRCLESHSQHAWAVRSIVDWIDWSGRKPRAESVLSAIRILSKKGFGEEVKKLVDSCLNENLACCVSKKGVRYEEMLYVGAVTALHSNGLYDDADEMFMSGISAGHLPFNFSRENEQFVLDLHGLSTALAHSAVRVAMRQHAATIAEEEKANDMLIITGRGRNSAFHLRPVLRPEVQRMLLEEFYPPLNTLSVPGNMGALKVLAQDIEAWQKYQEEQKGARMLQLADLLRNLSCPDRLTKSIAMSIRAIDKDMKNT
jgi:hypothetical protein